MSIFVSSPHYLPVLLDFITDRIQTDKNKEEPIMKNQNSYSKAPAYRRKYPNQAEHNILAQRVLDGFMMFSCCTGAISIISFLMAAF